MSYFISLNIGGRGYGVNASFNNISVIYCGSI